MTSLNFNLKTIGTGIAGAAAISAYLFKFRPWHLRWGATDEEIGRDLPGDDRLIFRWIDTRRDLLGKE